MCPILSYQNIATLTPVYLQPVICNQSKVFNSVVMSWCDKIQGSIYTAVVHCVNKPACTCTMLYMYYVNRTRWRLFGAGQGGRGQGK